MSDPRLQPVVHAALARVQTATRTAALQCVEALDRALFSGTRSDTERFVWQLAVTDLRRKLPLFNSTFNTVLKDRVNADLAHGTAGGRSFAETDWRSLSLVEDDVMEQQVSVDRLTRDIGDECEWELRELDAHIRALQLDEPDGRQRNPLRPELLGKALVKAIETVCDDPAGRKVLMREMSRSLARQMKACYAAIVEDMSKKGVAPVGLAVRTVEGPGNELARDGVRDTGYQPMKRDPRVDAQAAQALSAMFGVSLPAALAASDSTFGAPTAPAAFQDAPSPAGGWSQSHGGAPTGGLPSAQTSWPGGGPASGYPGGPSWQGAAGGAGGAPMQGGGFPHIDPHAVDAATRGMPGGGVAAPTGDARMLEVIRRLAFLATSTASSGGVTTPLSLPGGAGPAVAGARGARDAHGGPVSGGGGFDVRLPNVIRAYREELRQASSGALDHMVIDIVAALFDQVLADPNVPPQMARQIARLQLPVLRAALKDVGFFRSRRHPVRRLVNRIASLAAAYEEFDEGQGQEFLAKVKSLVQEIIEGDFDQINLYEEKLAELEALVGRQTARDEGDHAKVAALLDGKENALRLQQRFTLALKAPLAELALPDFARDFLAQVWSQVIVFNTLRDGHGAPAELRSRNTARELVMSLQPKGSPQHRKEFLVRLPALMKELREGLELVRWSEQGKKDFFGKLLPAHAASLKEAPLQDFDLRMLKQKLDQIDKIAVPQLDEEPTASQAAELEADETTNLASAEVTVPIPFTAEEAQQAGLVEEATVDWNGQVDVDLNLVAGGDLATVNMDLDLNLDAQTPPSSGVQLVHHMQPGAAYLMQIDDGGWKKVRLSWVSPGRGFFVFTQGRKAQKTLSMTARMLHRMCEAGRFRAFEQAELIERATIRARRQLAQLGGGPASA